MKQRGLWMGLEPTTSAFNESDVQPTPRRSIQGLFALYMAGCDLSVVLFEQLSRILV